MPETRATAVMVAKLGLIWTRSIFDNVLPREPCRIFGGGLRRVAWPGASFRLVPNRAADPAQIHRLPRHIVERHGSAMRYDFSNSNAAHPTALARAPITCRSGSLTPLSISARKASATPARVARSCWLRPA